MCFPFISSDGTINLGDYINTDKYLDVQFEGFYSKLDILMYYIAVSDFKNITDTDCKYYVSELDLYNHYFYVCGFFLRYNIILYCLTHLLTKHLRCQMNNLRIPVLQ